MNFIVAVIAVASALSAIGAAAVAVRASRSAHSLASKLHGMHSLQVELSEVSAALEKQGHLLKKINSRHVMRERRAEPEESSAPNGADPAALKAYLRQKAGLTAGKPAPHRE